MHPGLSQSFSFRLNPLTTELRHIFGQKPEFESSIFLMRFRANFKEMTSHLIVQVRDLLNVASNAKGGLKVREHPSRGFYREWQVIRNS